MEKSEAPKPEESTAKRLRSSSNKEAAEQKAGFKKGKSKTGANNRIKKLKAEAEENLFSDQKETACGDECNFSQTRKKSSELPRMLFMFMGKQSSYPEHSSSQTSAEIPGKEDHLR